MKFYKTVQDVEQTNKLHCMDFMDFKNEWPVKDASSAISYQCNLLYNFWFVFSLEKSWALHLHSIIFNHMLSWLFLTHGNKLKAVQLKSLTPQYHKVQLCGTSDTSYEMSKLFGETLNLRKKDWSITNKWTNIKTICSLILKPHPKISSSIQWLPLTVITEYPGWYSCKRLALSNHFHHGTFLPCFTFQVKHFPVLVLKMSRWVVILCSDPIFYFRTMHVSSQGVQRSCNIHP